jgi:hypothetical protein
MAFFFSLASQLEEFQDIFIFISEFMKKRKKINNIFIKKMPKW